MPRTGARIAALFQGSTLLLLTWGALAFGAEYAWAYTPLLVFSIVPVVLGLRTPRGSMPSRTLMIALAVIFLAGVLQLLVPARLVPLDLQSPPNVDFGRLYALVTMQRAPQETTRVISIAPNRTMVGLTFLAAFSLLLVGCTRAVSALGPKRLIHGIVILGCVVAFIGLIQANVKSETIYGFWRRARSGPPFAPFMNRNHFSGWMAMVLSLAIGSFAADVSTAFKNVKPGWRDRLLWFSSQRAGGMMLTAFAIALMTLSMVIATSRGGLVGLLSIVMIVMMLMLRRQAGWKRVVGGGLLLLILVIAMFWGDVGRTIDRFSNETEVMGGRQEIWTDTLHVVRKYPLTGTGLNTFAIAMLHYQTSPIFNDAVAESHNDYLQLAADGGLLLGIPILFALGVFCREVWRRFAEGLDDEETYWQRTGAVTGLCAIAVMEIFDFTLQIPGAAVMFVVLAAIAIHRPNHRQREQISSGRAARQ